MRRVDQLNTGHLFAGGGGGIYADLILGHQPQFAVEWAPYPAALLRQNFPGLHVHECDARLFDPSEYVGRIHSLHAGFPCTDISPAGTRRGVKGDKSGLWSEVVRVARAIRPRELFLENSATITVRGIDIVLSDLAGMGFDAAWACIPASFVGAPHLRNRWWCLARRSDADDTRQRAGGGSIHHENRNNAGRIHQEVSDAGCRGFEQSGSESAHPNARPGNQTDGRRFAQSEMGGVVDGLAAGRRDPSWWQVEPNIGRTTGRTLNRVAQIETLGNGQVPLQAAFAYQLLAGMYDKND